MLGMATSAAHRPWSRARPLAVATIAAILATGISSLAIGSLYLPSRESDSLAAILDPVPGLGEDATSVAASSTTDGRIDELIERIKANPDDGPAYRDLGLAFIQWFRETADPTLLTRAEQAFGEARTRLGDDPLVLVGKGALQLSRHQFEDALETGRRAVAAAPNLAAAHGVVADALVELGRYAEAIDTVEGMARLDSGLATLARVSYLRELHGDLPGALEAMSGAAMAGALDAPPENLAFTLVIVGNLQSWTGQREAAAAAYAYALERFPGYGPALAAQGRLAVAEGDLTQAIAVFERASDIVPLPEYVVALGEAREAAGDADGARESYELSRALSELSQQAGMVVDLELAVFEADHGDAAKALDLAEAAYRARPNVRAADALAWALFKSGRLDEAAERSHEALRLGSREPLLLYHGGAIAAATGRTDDARKWLTDALEVDAGWSATGNADARRILAAIG